MCNRTMLKSFLYFLLLLIFFNSCSGNSKNNPIEKVKDKDLLNVKTKAKAKDALAYCELKQMNTDFCILIDMSINSGKQRFFVWDFKNDSISDKFPVSHGCCNNIWGYAFSKENPKFSNVEGSHCTSLGKYKIGERGYSSWGINIKYLMHGLEEGNKNALKRQIVFHSWDLVPDNAIYPEGTPEGWGCPAISNENMRLIDKKLKSIDKPVLMWIYH
jgi:hypothetical protein